MRLDKLKKAEDKKFDLDIAKGQGKENMYMLEKCFVN